MAYLNFQNCTRQEYEDTLYSQDAKNKIKILFNNVELENADLYCEKFTVKPRIIPNGAKVFSLNNFISKEAELILHDIDINAIQDQVTISIGTLVNNTYEYVPIGIFNIQDQPTTDKNKTTIKLRDNSVKFDFNYNAQTLIEANNGSATKLQILQDICTQANVTCNITSFIGYLDEIGVYDNTVTARQYIANIAEQAGKIATINRSGELIFIDLNDLTTWQIPIGIVEKYEEGTSFKIGKVVYEDGIVRYETADSNDDTLFLDGSNNYINGELVKEQASSSNNSYSLDSTGDNADLAKFELEGKTTQATRSGKNLFGGKEFTYSGSGLTSTYNIEGSILLNGTFSGSGTYYTMTSGQASQNDMLITLPAGTYTLSVNTSTHPNIQVVKSNGSAVYTLSSGSSSGTFTLSTDTNVFVRIAVASGSTYSNVTYKIQLEAGSTATTWEQYGVQPSPDYPSELVSVGYHNLLKNTNVNSGDNNYWQTYTTFDEATRTVTRSTTTTSEVFIYHRVGLKSGTTYTLTLYAKSNGYVKDMEMYVFNQNTQGIRNKAYNITNEFQKYTFTFTTDSNVDYSINAVIRIDNNGSTTSGTEATLTIKDVCLVEGDKSCEYVDYDEYGIQVETTSANIYQPLLETNGTTITVKNANATLDDDEFSLTATGSDMYIGQIASTGNKYSYDRGNLIDVTGLSKIYFNVSNSDIKNNLMTAYDENFISLGYYGGGGSSSGSINIPSGAKYVSFRFGYSQATSGTTYKFKVMVSKEPITEYQKYVSNTYNYTLDEPLRSIGTYKDKLYIKNNMLYVERKIGKVVLNGSETETWTAMGWTSKYAYRTTVDNIFIATNSNTKGYLKSNYFIDYTQNELFALTAGSGSGISLRANQSEIIVRNDSYTTLTNFKTWLGTHNTKVDYVLATPYIEELGEIELPRTYKGTTYIDIYSNIDTNSYIQYRKDKTQLEAILEEVDEFDIDSFKTGKILGNPAIDGYDLIQIHDKSKNILENNMTNQSINGLTFTKNSDGSILVNGTATAETNKTIISTIALNNTKQYTLSGTVGGDNSTYHLRVCTTGWGDNHYNYNGYDTFTPRDTANYQVMISIRNGTTLNNVLFEPMLVEGTQRIDYVPYKDETYTTLATSDLTYNGVITNSFDTQIGQEAKEQNVTIKGEATFQKWARTQIDNVEGTINLQAGQINDANNRINETNLQISSQGALLNVIANNSNIDIQYDADGNPLNGEVREVTTTTGFTFNAEGMTIQDSSSNFKAQHRNTGTYYKDGDNIVGQYTKDGSKQKDLELFGVYYYGKDDIDDDPMFVAQLFTDYSSNPSGEAAFGHFYNRGD